MTACGRDDLAGAWLDVRFGSVVEYQRGALRNATRDLVVKIEWIGVRGVRRHDHKQRGAGESNAGNSVLHSPAWIWLRCRAKRARYAWPGTGLALW